MPAVETRNRDRDSLFLMADLVIDGDPKVRRTKIRNLSAKGLMAQGEIEVERGARLCVTLRNIGKVKGAVAWVEGNRFGVAFDNEIDPKLARAPLDSGDSEAPGYARPILTPPINDGWNGRLRKV